MNKDFEEIDDAIEELTTTGKKGELDAEYIKKLKTLCRQCTENLIFAYKSLISQLEQQHAEIRFSAFQVINELFMRSHKFRELVIDDLQDIFVLTVESEKNKFPLPPPDFARRKLKKLFLEKYNLWFKTFGPGYLKLQLGHDFLSDVMKVRFNKIEVQTLAEQESEARAKEKQNAVQKSKLEQVDIQYYDRKDDIASNIKEMANCFDLLVEKITDNETANDRGAHRTEHNNLSIGNEAGISSHNFTLEVKISNKQFVLETPDNTHIIDRLRELFRENCRYEKDANRWLNVLTKCGSKDAPFIREVLKLKNELSSVLRKYGDIKFEQAIPSSDEDEGEIFLDVPEKTEDDQQPTCSKYLSNEPIETAPSTSRDANHDSPSLTVREKHLQAAPVITFDSDLKFWESADLDINSVKYDSLHRFWKTNDHPDNFVPPAVEASVRERSFKYESEFKPVRKKCCALLPNGKFCQRMDRKKCPFHGQIVERNAFGQPIHPADIERDNERKRKREEEEKKKIQKDIEATLGTTLSPKKKYKKGALSRKEISRARYKRLSKLGEKAKSKENLEKKVFSVRSRDRISNTMNEHIRKRHMERFGSNFNY